MATGPQRQRNFHRVRVLHVSLPPSFSFVTPKPDFRGMDLKLIFLEKSTYAHVEVSNVMIVWAVRLHMFEWVATIPKAKSMLQNMLFYLSKIKVLSHKARHQAYEEHQNMNHAQ